MIKVIIRFFYVCLITVTIIFPLVYVPIEKIQNRALKIFLSDARMTILIFPMIFAGCYVLYSRMPSKNISILVIIIGSAFLANSFLIDLIKDSK